MPETPPDFAQLIPPQGSELLAADELSAAADIALEPEDLLSTDLQADERAEYGMSWQWDFSINRFVRNGSAPNPVWETDNLRGWIQAIMNISRLTHPIFPDNIGMEEPYGLIGEGVDDVAAQEAYMEDVASALMEHDRISEVTNFDFTVPDALIDYQAGTGVVPGGGVSDQGPLATHLPSIDVYFEVITDDGDVLPIAMSYEP